MILEPNQKIAKATVDFEKSFQVDSMLKEANQFLQAYNRYALMHPNFKPVNVADYMKSFEQRVYEKGLDATTTVARGTRLLQTNYINRPKTFGPQGGAFEEAGAEIVRNAPGQVVQFFNHYGGTGSGFTAAATNASTTWSGLTSTTNDQAGTIFNEQATMTLQVVEVFIRKSVLQGYLGNANDILSLYEDDFNRRLELLIDEVGADAVVLNSNVAGFANSGATVGNLIQTFLNARADLRSKGAVTVDLHVNTNGLLKIESERASTTGEFLLKNTISSNKNEIWTPVRSSDGTMKNVGLVGILDGSRVFLNHGVRNTYTASGNNISAITGGTKTAMIIGTSELLGVGVGKDDVTGSYVFRDELDTFRRGAVVVGRDVFVGGVPTLPTYWTYSHFDA
jgi:hypothetical protein